MNTNDNYFIHYILRLFKYNQTNSGQIVNIFHGRRTPSMLYLAVKNQWFDSFNLFPKVKRGEIEGVLAKFRNKDWIVESGNYYELTAKGNKELNSYFTTHSYPSHTLSINTQPYRLVFWQRFQFMTQIISEKEYNNSNYSPINRNIYDQNWAKRFLQKYKNTFSSLSESWISESIKTFSLLTHKSSNFLAKLLVGHDVLGNTFKQVSGEVEWTPIEGYVLFNDFVEEMLTIIFNSKDDLPLLNEMLGNIQREFHYGLSKSSFETAQFLSRNIDLKIVAKKRNLKESTIKEHLLEVAIVQPRFDFKPFIPENDYMYLYKIFKQFPGISYAELKSQNKSVDFMNFRLVELERMRSSNGFK